MQHVGTTIFDYAVWMRYADSPNSDEATEWIEFQVPLESLTHPGRPGQPLGEPDRQFVGDLRLAALGYARDAIDEEIRRLQEIAGSMR
jgi:hypothetical protein